MPSLMTDWAPSINAIINITVGHDSQRKTAKIPPSYKQTERFPQKFCILPTQASTVASFSSHRSSGLIYSTNKYLSDCINQSKTIAEGIIIITVMKRKWDLLQTICDGFRKTLLLWRGMNKTNNLILKLLISSDSLSSGI